MAYQLHVPGERSRALRWTDKHPQSSYGHGVLLYRNTADILDGAAFRAMRDGRGAWLETDQPKRARSALGLMETESLGAPPASHKAQLAHETRAWRARIGVTAATAAAMIGLPKATYDFIEQGRGFRYPETIRLAMEAITAKSAKRR